jgi:hypothetical protein
MSAAIRTIIRRIGAGDGFDNTTTHPDDTPDDFISDALTFVPVSKLGNRADLAAAYYTCHLMLMATSAVSSTGGAIAREKAGDVERSFHAGSSASSGATSKYYELYLQLVKNLTRMSPFVLNGR